MLDTVSDPLHEGVSGCPVSLWREQDVRAVLLVAVWGSVFLVPCRHQLLGQGTSSGSSERRLVGKVQEFAHHGDLETYGGSIQALALLWVRNLHASFVGWSRGVNDLCGPVAKFVNLVLVSG